MWPGGILFPFPVLHTILVQKEPTSCWSFMGIGEDGWIARPRVDGRLCLDSHFSRAITAQVSVWLFVLLLQDYPIQQYTRAQRQWAFSSLRLSQLIVGVSTNKHFVTKKQAKVDWYSIRPTLQFRNNVVEKVLSEQLYFPWSFYEFDKIVQAYKEQ